MLFSHQESHIYNKLWISWLPRKLVARSNDRSCGLAYFLRWNNHNKSRIEEYLFTLLSIISNKFIVIHFWKVVVKGLRCVTVFFYVLSFSGNWTTLNGNFLFFIGVSEFRNGSSKLINTLGILGYLIFPAFLHLFSYFITPTFMYFWVVCGWL